MIGPTPAPPRDAPLPDPHRTAREGRNIPRHGYALLIAAILLHLSMLLSWRLGFWNRWTFDATATHGRRGWDFYAIYQAGHNVLTGISAYESDNDKIHVVVPLHTPYRYLPLIAYTLGVAFNALSPLWAYRLWVATIEMTLLACAYGAWRLGGGGRRGAALAAMWLAFTPYYLEIYFGQFSLIQAALVWGMMVAASRPPLSWRYDAYWIASLLWKQNTGLFIPLYLRQRRWRALVGAGAAVALTSLPYFARDPSGLRAFLSNFQGGPMTPQLGNLGVRQLLFSLTAMVSPNLSSAGHEGIQRAWVAIILAIGLWLTLSDRRPDALLYVCFWTTTYFLVYHDVWEHHYVLLLPVLVMLYWRNQARIVLAIYGLVAIWTPYILIDPQGLAAYHMPMRWTFLEPHMLDVLYHASKAAPTLALWGYLISLIRQGRALPETR